MEETRGVSRRSFLKGAALAGVGAATASMFAGCAPSQSSEAATATEAGSTAASTNTSAASTDGSANPAWLGEAPTVDESKVESDVQPGNKFQSITYIELYLIGIG